MVFQKGMGVTVFLQNIIVASYYTFLFSNNIAWQSHLDKKIVLFCYFFLLSVVKYLFSFSRNERKVKRMLLHELMFSHTSSIAMLRLFLTFARKLLANLHTFPNTLIRVLKVLSQALPLMSSLYSRFYYSHFSKDYFRCCYILDSSTIHFQLLLALSL